MECIAAIQTMWIILVVGNYFQWPASTHPLVCQLNCHLSLSCSRFSTQIEVSYSSLRAINFFRQDSLEVLNFCPWGILPLSSVNLLTFCTFQFNCPDSWVFQPSHGMLGIVIDIYPGLTRVYLEFWIWGLIVAFFSIVLHMLEITCIFTICIGGIWLRNLYVRFLWLFFVPVVVARVVNI